MCLYAYVRTVHMQGLRLHLHQLKLNSVEVIADICVDVAG